MSEIGLLENPILDAWEAEHGTNDIHQRDTVDASIPAELWPAVQTLIRRWEQAKGNQYVRQPVSYAMYNTWREIEQEEEKK